MLRFAKNRNFQIGAIAVCFATVATVFAIYPLRSEIEPAIDPVSQFQNPEWRRMNPTEETDAWNNILENPLGIAALNQLAIEGFINPICEKSFYTNDAYSGFQFLLRVKCAGEGGVSAAVGYDEMRVTFNRFESNIEDFEVERFGTERQPTILLPD